MISREEIEKLALLSRIELRDEEVEALQKDISNILEYVGKINALQGDAGADVPKNHNVMRDDVPYTPESQLLASRDAVVEALPTHEKDYNVVRKIIQKDE